MLKKTVIWHIADLHIERKRHKALYYAFDFLISKIRLHATDNPDDIMYLCIVGDVFEYKIKYSQLDLVCFHHLLNLTQTIANLKVIIMPGNHDYSEANETDLIYAALINTKYDNIYHFSASGKYVFPDVEFYVHSPIDKIIPTLPMALTAAKRIALVHEPIEGCKAYGGIQIMNSRLSANSLGQKYDLVLLGDIHKKQFILPNVAYCGSFVQKTKAEDYQHGCIKWTFDDASSKDIVSEFINFDQIELYLTIKVEDNKICKFTTTHIKSARYIEIAHFNSSKQGIDHAVKVITEKFGMRPHNIKSLGVKQKDQILSTSDSLPNQIQCIESNQQLNIIHSILEESKCLQLWDEIKALHIQRAIHKNDKLKWDILQIKWSNLFCYGPDNIIDFTKFDTSDRRVFSLIGRNKTGKSSILDILLLILFNHISRGTRSSIIRKGCNSFNIECIFKVGPYKYQIERSSDEHEMNKCKLYKLLPTTDVSVASETTKEDMSGSTIIETYQIMRDLIGEYREFINVNIAMQSGQLFTDESALSQRVRILQFLELEHLHTLSKSIDQEIRVLKKTIKALQGTLSSNPPQRKLYETELSAKLVELSQVQIEIQQIIPKLSMTERSVKNKSSSNVIEQIKQLGTLLPSISNKNIISFHDLEKLKQEKYLLEKDLNVSSIQLSGKSESELYATLPSKYRSENDNDLNNHAEQSLSQINKLSATKQLVVDVYKNKPVLPDRIVIGDVSDIITKINDLQNQLSTLSLHKVEHTKSYWETVLASDNQTRDNIYIITLRDTITKLINETSVSKNRKTKFSKDELLHLIQHPPNTLIYLHITTKQMPVKPLKPNQARSASNLTELKNIIHDLQLKTVSQTLLPIFKFEKNCNACDHNAYLFQSNSDKQDLMILEKYLHELAIYQSNINSFTEYEKAVATNTKIEEYQNVKNDLEYFDQQEQINKLTALKKEYANIQLFIRAKEQILLFIQNEKTEAERSIILSQLQTYQKQLDTTRRYMTALSMYELSNEQYHIHLRNIEIDDKIGSLRMTIQTIKEIRFIRTNNKLRALSIIITDASNIIQYNSLVEDLANLQYNENLQHERNALLTRHSELSIREQELHHSIQEIRLSKSALENYDRVQKLISDKQHELDVKTAYSKCLCLNTGISERLLNMYLDNFEKDVNQILHDITDFTIYFARTKDANFTYTISHANTNKVVLPADLSSGFQRWIIDTAIRIAFVSRHPSLPGFLIIDEGFGCMDPEHLTNMREFLDSLNHQSLGLSWLLIISHVDDLNQIGINNPRIVQSSDGSSLIKY